MAEDTAVTKFREYLRVNTEQPRPDYAGCQKFLFGLADELGITRKAVEAVSSKAFREKNILHLTRGRRTAMLTMLERIDYRDLTIVGGGQLIRQHP
ncbi:hypothetical protein ANCDUO_23004 [Ancylostoma duodenale]|uniref:Uncharacterized protein n=1 Tax=Ancylostoma duodenale TaxID=51022 RepID=A0A0C2FEF9_9BILA|nr:hypothetical protein ANCDUO_23004 [Ancylostoma duodenale]